MSQESHVSAQTPSPSFFFPHGKCHQKKKKNLYPIWDLVNGAPAPHSTLKAEVALSCPVEFPEAPVESVRDISLFGTKETTAGKHPSPLITRMFTFSSSINLTNILSTNEFSFLPLPADIKKSTSKFFFFKNIGSVFKN